MADVGEAISYVLTWEDATLSGAITQRRDKNGKVWLTRFGIDQEFHQNLTNCLFFSSMGSQAALITAKGIYEREYADPLCIAEIPDQCVANKLLSLGVNCGIKTASQWLQDAVDVNGDGRIGPLTLDALDHADPGKILDLLRTQAEAYYEHLVQENPDDSIYFNGWLKRARA